MSLPQELVDRVKHYHSFDPSTPTVGFSSGNSALFVVRVEPSGKETREKFLLPTRCDELKSFFERMTEEAKIEGVSLLLRERILYSYNCL
jgi:hypothetical protein